MPPDVTHLDDNAASEFVSGSLSASAQSKIEAHLASCRDCRALVAALAMDAGTDSNAATVPHERVSPSQVAPRPTRTLTIGDRVGRYLVLSALGAGGMGVVFAAYDPQLDRKVALKLLRAGITYNTQDARTRLRREAQAIAQLSHPNVVGVYDVGTTEDGDLYIAMEFVEGDTLTSWLKKYPRTWREIVDVFLQAARGLLAAHSVGLLHRDFKPDNVLVGGDGRVRVTDFGLARSVITPEDAVRPGGAPTSGASALSVELTATGTVLGTPRYMAPEQLTGPDIDARADQFSFCVALYEALYGGHPLPGATSVAMLERHEKAAPPPEGTKVPSAVGRAVMTGLERDRSKRFPTMGALISALVPAPRRSPARYAAVALAGILVTGGAVAAALNREPPEAPVPLDVDGKPLDPIGPLVMKINELQEQLNQRDAENRALLAELTLRKPDVERIQQLQSEIALRDDKIEKLVREVAELKGTRLPRRPPPRQEELANGALARKIGDLESCLVEWSLRQSGDADLKFQMTASASGLGHGVEPLPPTDRDDRLGPSLRQCVGDVLGRVRFEPGPDNLDLHVHVKWIADMRSVVVSASVVGQRKATQTLLD
ncbi:MAG TPA: protein kinase [Kofleriaceae bacterium]|nr:protein kinase [Kofleriaceae bacterium]